MSRVFVHCDLVHCVTLILDLKQNVHRAINRRSIALLSQPILSLNHGNLNTFTHLPLLYCITGLREYTRPRVYFAFSSAESPSLALAYVITSNSADRLSIVVADVLNDFTFKNSALFILDIYDLFRYRNVLAFSAI